MSDIFKGTKGPRDAKIMVVGESYGSEETRLQKPLVGATGRENDKILTECGIEPASCFYTNVVNSQPGGNEMSNFFYTVDEAKERYTECIRGLYPNELVMEGLHNLYACIDEVQPEIIIGYGNYTLWALTDNCFSVVYNKLSSRRKLPIPTGIVQWRGSQLRTRNNIPFLPTIHPASIFRNWPYRYAIKHDISARVPIALGKVANLSWDAPAYNFTIRPSFQTVMETLSWLLRKADQAPLLLSDDLETRDGQIACIGLGWSKLDAICIPFMCIERKEGYWSFEEEFEIYRCLRKLFKHPNVSVVGQNFLYDLQYHVLHFSAVPNVFADTMIMHHLCYPGTNKGLDYLSSLYCDYHSFWKNEGKEWTKDMDEDRLWSYNCRDCVTTFEVCEALLQLIKQFKLEDQFKWQMRQVPMILRIMLRGVRIDRKRRAEVTMHLIEEISKRSEWLEYMMSDVWPKQKGKSPWYTSPTQQMELFYEVLGVPKSRRGRKRNVTVNDEALEKIAASEPLLRKIIATLQEMRSLRVFLNNFCRAELDPDYRMRCSYDPTGTATFRWNSKENAFGYGTNLQNIPKGSED